MRPNDKTGIIIIICVYFRPYFIETVKKLKQQTY